MHSSNPSNSDLFSMATTERFMNKSVEWMNYPFTSFCYVVIVLFCWAALHVSQFFSEAECWTATNVIHGVVTSLHKAITFVFTHLYILIEVYFYHAPLG